MGDLIGYVSSFSILHTPFKALVEQERAKYE